MISATPTQNNPATDQEENLALAEKLIMNYRENKPCEKGFREMAAG
jgi:hypothetical protein